MTLPIPLPIPLIDHVIVNARDGLDDAATLWTRLGFTLTPRGHHTLGSSNNLAILGTDYIELLGVQPGAQRTDVLDWPAGLNGLVFKTLDSDGVHAALAAAGAPVLPPQAFSRPVDMGDGTARDAAFRTVRIARDAVPAGRMFFCHHMTPELVWHDPWRRHANGAIGIAGFGITAPDPGLYADLFTRLFGPAAIRRDGAAVTLLAGLATVTVTQAPTHVMTSLTLRTASLAMARTALASSGLPHHPDHAAIPLPGGFSLVFVE